MKSHLKSCHGNLKRFEFGCYYASQWWVLYALLITCLLRDLNESNSKLRTKVDQKLFELEAKLERGTGFELQTEFKDRI